MFSFFKFSIASIDFVPPTVLTGSSDKHVRLFDMSTLQGWATSPDCDSPTPAPFLFESSSNPVSNTIGESSSSNSAYSDTNTSSVPVVAPGLVCQTCGSDRIDLASTSPLGVAMNRVRSGHRDLVRTVVLGQEFVLSGSYDASIKVSWWPMTPY